MKKFKKRFIAWVLTFALVFCTVPIMSFADEIDSNVETTASQDVSNDEPSIESTNIEPANFDTPTELSDEPTEPVLHRHNPITCDTCLGTGTIAEEQACPDCDGPAEIEMVSCEKCQGEGIIIKVTFDFNIPCPNNGEACNGCDDCIMGYAKIYKELECSVCKGSGEVFPEGAEVCDTCTGKGTVMVDVDCPDCENGKVACNGEFDAEGVLTDVRGDGVGIITHICDTCKASYDDEMSAEETKQLIADSLFVGSLEASKSSVKGAKPGEEVCFTLQVRNTSKVTARNINLVFALDSWLLPENTAEGEEAEDVANAMSNVVELQNQTIYPGDTKEFKIKATIAEEATPGSYCGISLQSIALEDIAVADNGAAAEIRVNRYGNQEVILIGQNMGRWSGFENNTTAEYPSAAGTLDDIAELAALEYAALNFTPAEYWDEYVVNMTSNRVWQCVGFIPYVGSTPYHKDLVKNYTFSDDARFPQYKAGDLAAAEGFIADHNGVLYGEAPTEEQLAAWESKMNGRELKLIAVWFVADTSVKKLEHGELGIIPVEPVIFEKSSENVEITGHINTVGHKNDVTFDVVINAGSTDIEEVVINLADISNHVISVEPGDSIVYHINIVDNSGKNYRFKQDSAVLGAYQWNFVPENVLGIGFDGKEIPADRDVNGKSAIPMRVANQALTELGVTDDLSDEAIGALLIEYGYGDTGQTPAEVTQTYLGHYYLDYISATSRQEVHSLQDISNNSVAMLFTSKGKGIIPETCQDVAEAYYYFYYGRCLTFNDVSLYDHMSDSSALNADIAKALNKGTVYELIAKVDGEMMRNATQASGFVFNHALRFELEPAQEVSEASYKVIHEYYTNNEFSGSTSDSYSALPGIVIKAEDIAKVLNYNGDVYAFTSVDKASITVTEDGTAVITLRYDRKTVGEASYKVVHQYFTDNALTGSTETSNTAKAGTVINAGDIERILSYNGDTYAFTSIDAESITVTEDGTAVITLRYDRTTGNNTVNNGGDDNSGDDESETPNVPSTPDEATLPEPDVPLAELPDEEIPLSELPVDEEEEILDEDVPMSDVPQTGDNLLLWFFAAAASGLAALTVGRKRK